MMNVLLKFRMHEEEHFAQSMKEYLQISVAYAIVSVLHMETPMHVKGIKIFGKNLKLSIVAQAMLV